MIEWLTWARPSVRLDSVFQDDGFTTTVCLKAADCNMNNTHPRGSFPGKVFYREFVALITDLDKGRTVNSKFTENYTAPEYFLNVPFLKNSGSLERGCVPIDDVFYNTMMVWPQ